MKKIAFLLISVLLFSCSKKGNEESTATLNITTISPVNNSSVKKSIDAEFTWNLSASDASAPVYSGIKIVEIIGNESPENAMRTNKPFFERDSLVNKLIIKPPTGAGTPGLVLDKKYVWQITAKQKTLSANSALSVFTVVQ